MCYSRTVSRVEIPVHHSVFQVRCESTQIPRNLVLNLKLGGYTCFDNVNTRSTVLSVFRQNSFAVNQSKASDSTRAVTSAVLSGEILFINVVSSEYKTVFEVTDSEKSLIK